ncbi:MAG: bifunctional nuclease family protein [Candidatus Hydrogenedentes bacterium]|nr:bifunctional nuclease family protein [Candidatus Hydrogenedentota bacterium]MBI3118923.1 bifunctional nuclease family protein [Candidatus Hydrogenedentota bacterium]
MVELEVLGVSHADGQSYPLVLLGHGTRVLPILVGIPEASAIHMGLTKEKTPRPMTHDLVCNLLAGLRASLQSVNIYRLENDTFFAHLNVEQRNPQGHVEQVLRIDTRPSDGIAIAVRVGCPIFAAEDVMELAGQDASIIATGEAEEEEEEDEDEFEEGE